MIRTLRGTPRRIAVLEYPRTALNRLGRLATIRDAQPFVSLTPLSNEDPVPTTASWLARILAAQSTARETTPGTLIYTPAPAANPAPVIGTWNSWAGPCASSDNSAAATTSSTTTTKTKDKFWFYLAAGLGAAASAAYLIEAAKGNRKS